MSYQRMRFLVGLFILALVLTSVTLAFFVLQKRGTFEQKYKYSFITQSAESLKVGTPLFLSGFEIGYIDELQLTDTGDVKVRLSVSERNNKWIRQDSSLILHHPLIGSAYIEIITKPEALPLSEGAELPITISEDINKIIAKLDPALNHFTIIMSDIGKITARLAESESLISALTGNPQDGAKVSQALDYSQQALAELNQTLKNTQHITGGVETNVMQPTNQLITQLDLVLKTVHKITLDLENKLQLLDGTVEVVANSNKDIDLLKQQIIRSVETTNELVDRVNYLLGSNKPSRLDLP